MIGGKEGVRFNVVAEGFLASNSGLGEVFGFDSFGDFFLPEQLHLQFTLVLFGAPDGLDGVVIGFGNAAVATLEAGDRVMQVSAQKRQRAEQNCDETCGPEKLVESTVKQPDQAGLRVRRSGFGLECSRDKYGSESATEKQREDGLNIDEVAGATEQFEQDSFHGISFVLLVLSHGEAENLRNGIMDTPRFFPCTLPC
jgi:hypothetical protein